MGRMSWGHIGRGMGYLLPDDAVDDIPQALVGLAGKDPLQTQCPLLQCFSHTNV